MFKKHKQKNTKLSKKPLSREPAAGTILPVANPRTNRLAKYLKMLWPKNRTIRISIVVILVAVVGLLGGIWGISKYKQSKIVKIGDNTVTQANVNNYAQSIEAYKKANPEVRFNPDIKQEALDDLIMNAALKKEAKERNKMLTEAELREIYEIPSSVNNYLEVINTQAAAKDGAYYEHVIAENLELSKNLQTDLIATRSLFYTGISFDGPAARSEQDKAQLEQTHKQAKEKLKNEFLPMFEKKLPKEVIAKKANINYTAANTDIKKNFEIFSTDPLAVFADYFKYYVNNEHLNEKYGVRDVIAQDNNMSAFKDLNNFDYGIEVRDLRDTATEINKLKNAGDYTPVFASKTGNYMIARLESKSGGQYDTFQDFLNKYKDEYKANRFNLTAVGIISNYTKKVISKIAQYQPFDLIQKVYALVCAGHYGTGSVGVVNAQNIYQQLNVADVSIRQANSGGGDCGTGASATGRGYASIPINCNTGNVPSVGISNVDSQYIITGGSLPDPLWSQTVNSTQAWSAYYYALRIPPPPPNVEDPTCTLSASPTELPAGGGNVTLSWTSTHTSSGTVNGVVLGNAGTPTSRFGGSLPPIRITQSTTFFGTWQGTNGRTVNCNVRVRVGQPPCTPPDPDCTPVTPTVSCNLRISETDGIDNDNKIRAGSNARLTWNTSSDHPNLVNADVSEEFEPGRWRSIASTPNGSAVIGANLAPGYHAYMMSVYDTTSGAAATCHATLHVVDDFNPPCEMHFDPETIQAGQSTRLFWSTLAPNAEHIGIRPFINGTFLWPPINTTGEVITPTTTTTYTGEVYPHNSNFDAICEATVYVVTLPTPGVQPYLTTEEGDVHSGGNLSDAVCPLTTSTTKGNIQGRQSGATGSRATYAVSAGADIREFGSAQETSLPGKLTFGNITPGHYGVVCREDIAAKYLVPFEKGETVPDGARTIPVDASGIKTLNATDISSLSSGVYIVPGNLVIGNVGENINVAGPKHLTFVAKGNVQMNANVRLSGGGATRNDLPSFGVVAQKNLYIAPTVETLEGMYSAGTDPVRYAGTPDSALDPTSIGVVDTCKNNVTLPNNVFTPQISTPGGAASCNKRLELTGALAGRTMYFRRTPGDVRAPAPGNFAAEQFRFNAIVYLQPPIGFGDVSARINEQKERPPLF